MNSRNRTLCFVGLMAVGITLALPSHAFWGKKKKAKKEAEAKQAAEQMKEAVKAAVRALPPPAPSPMAEAVKLAMQKQWDAALAKLGTITGAAEQTNAQRCVLAVRALKAYEAKQYKDAVRLFAECAKTREGFVRDEVWLNAALQPGSDPQPLLDYCDAHPASKDALEVAAALYDARGPAEARQAVYKKLAKLLEQEYEASGRPAALLRRLGKVYEAAGDLTGAAAVLEGFTQDAKTPEPWVELAALWQRQGNAARAKACIETGMELLDPTDILGKRRLMALRDGEWDERGKPWALAETPPPAISLAPLRIALTLPGSGLSVPSGDRDQYGNAVVTRNGQRFDPTTGLPYEIWLEQPRVEFVYIPPGEFVMGSKLSPDEVQSRYGNENTKVEWFKGEHPQRRVRLTKGFYLGKYEVTQSQWQGAMGTSPWTGQTWTQNAPRNAAVYVSWDDCQAFTAKLSAGGRAARRAASGVFRLPTEAEWEYACRAGTTTVFSFGDDAAQLGEYAWFDENAYRVDEKYAHGVGLKRPNPWGLYDMHGNVWEWCRDWFADYGGYPAGDITNPIGARSGSYRVSRGGGWRGTAVRCRSANRDRYSPSFTCNCALGVRLVLVPAGQQ